jgi:hypothetical protein
MKYLVECENCGWSLIVGPQKDAKQVKQFHVSEFGHFDVNVRVTNQAVNDVPEERRAKPWNSETCH